MRRAAGVLLTVLGMAACESDTTIVVPGDGPSAPRALEAFYYGGVVTVTWELGPGWNGEPFRVYAKRTSDADWFFIAEVTNCSGGVCSYQDRNVVEGVTYLYYVAAVDPATGVEAATDYSVEVAVPFATAPPDPTGVQAVALDGAIYLRWSDVARGEADFSFYRIYQDAGANETFLLGETDSEGFLDELAVNGETYRYFVTSVDTQGHESAGSGPASGTPRPDFSGEYLYAASDRPDRAGFRFQADESVDPVMDAFDASRHFRLEIDAAGWWLVPGPGTSVHPQAFATTALKCGPGADASCQDLSVAPTSGYTTADLPLDAQTSYALRVRGDDGQTRYATIRVVLLGFDQNDDALIIFDWAYQLQPGNPALAPRVGTLAIR